MVSERWKRMFVPPEVRQMADELLARSFGYAPVDTQVLGVLGGSQALIKIQYKPTHPLWGFLPGPNGPRSQSLEPKPLDDRTLERLIEDFRRRCGGIPMEFLQAARQVGILQVAIELGKGVDSSVTFSFVGVFPEGHEYAGMTVAELRDGENVRIALSRPKE